jgi:hypothetical protein
MGGIALGKAVLSSGLLEDLDRVLQGAVEGMGLYKILMVFSVIALVIATLCVQRFLDLKFRTHIYLGTVFRTLSQLYFLSRLPKG